MHGTGLELVLHGGHCNGLSLSLSHSLSSPGLFRWGDCDFAKAPESRNTSLSSLRSSCEVFLKPEPGFIRCDHVSAGFWTHTQSAWCIAALGEMPRLLWGLVKYPGKFPA